MELGKIRKIYFVGIGGIGMSAVAGIAKAQGFEVEGSDATDVYEPSKGVLDKYAVPYHIGYSASNFDGADLVVTTSAVDQTNPELAKALENNIPVASFAELLAELVKDKKQVLVVGTHGKGTTAGLIAYAMLQENNCFFVGGVLTDLNTNFAYGKGPYMVIEGDEYKTNFDNNKPKFSYFNPDILLINNIEYDHPDMYPDLSAYKKAFQNLAESLPETSKIVYNADDANVVEVIQNAKAQKIEFSMSNLGSNLSALISQGKLPGKLYAYDYLAAVTVLKTLGYTEEWILPVLQKYSGIKRRYEIISQGNYTVIDDYAHHPTAVKATLDATKEKYAGRRVVAFFEPHTYSRTKETLSDLAQAFGSADLVYLAEVYPAREQKLPSSITGREVAAAIAVNNPNVRYVVNREEALREYSKETKPGDVIVVMAVGSFNTLAYDLKGKYGK